MNKLQRRVIDLSYKLGLSHIGSCISTVDTLNQIYTIKKSHEPFILSNGHSALALYVVLEEFEGQDAEALFKKHGVHPNIDPEAGIWASSGSLGHGLGIAVGYAMSNRDRLVYVTISDGEAAEGSIWEALRIASDNRLENLRIALIANGYGAYDPIDIEDLDNRINAFYPTMMIKTNMFTYPDYLQGQSGHYHTLTEEQYKEVIA